MYVIVEHTAPDPQAFGAAVEAAEIPPHLTLHQVLPKDDGTRSVCLWEGPSVDAVRTFVEEGVGHVSRNVYFAVDADKAMGLPAAGLNGRMDGPVTFEFDQAATGPGTFAGTFEASGAISDTGTTEDALDVSSAEGVSPLVATFRRTVTGEKGTLVLTGDATVDLADPSAAEVDGSWQVESATGDYAGHTGSGSISGTADFTLEQPRGTLRYTGDLRAA